MTDTQTGTPCCSSSCCGDDTTARTATVEKPAEAKQPRRLDVELLVIDLDSCARCVPTSKELRGALQLIAPAAEALDIRLTYRETVVQTAAEARARALLSSPTIRINGRDIEQDIRESECESCGDLTEDGTIVECREWHYRGEVYPAAPLPYLLEVLMDGNAGARRAALCDVRSADGPSREPRAVLRRQRPATGSCCC